MFHSTESSREAWHSCSPARGPPEQVPPGPGLCRARHHGDQAQPARQGRQPSAVEGNSGLYIPGQDLASKE